MSGASEKPKANRPGTKGHQRIPGEKVYHGHAYRLYSRYAKDQSLLKRQLLTMMKALVKEGKFNVSSQAQLKTFVDKQFERFDVNEDASLSFEEFLEFFDSWLDVNAQALLDTHRNTVKEVELVFLKFDANHDFQLTKDELRKLVVARNPRGIPPPPDSEIDEIVDNCVAKYASTSRGKSLSFDEFSGGYNELCDAIRAMHVRARSKIMEQTGFRGMLKRWDSRDELLEAVKGRFDGPVWFVPKHEAVKAAERATSGGKRPLFLDTPPGELDLATTEFGEKGIKVIDVQDIAMRNANKTITAEEACETLADAVNETMTAGAQLVLRMGHAAPDWMISWNLPRLPVELLNPACTAPGKLHPDLSAMFPDGMAGPGVEAQVNEGFGIVLTSCFSMQTYREYLRAKLPFQWIQPIQVCGTSFEEVHQVMTNGLPKDEMDDDLAMLDLLGAAL